MRFNTDLQLWVNQRQRYLDMPNNGAVLCVSDGSVSDGYSVLARFTDDKEASEVLSTAGFKKIQDNPIRFKAQRNGR